MRGPLKYGNTKMNQVTKRPSHKVVVISGSIGTAGERLARKVTSQFTEADLEVEVISHVKTVDQITEIVDKVASIEGTIVHTLVNNKLKAYLLNLAEVQNVYVVDIVSDFMDRLSDTLGQQPAGRPGLYRNLHADYFRRIEALKFTMSHDDGKNFETWHKADIVLIGVSRVGKTPLSIYLAMIGWKVVNVPLVPGIPPREQLFQLDQRRVIGLTIDPGQLKEYRQTRQKTLGAPGPTRYNNLVKLYEELDEAMKIFRKGRFRILDVTNMPIEGSAAKIVNWITHKR